MENRYKIALDFKYKFFSNISFKQNDIDTDVLEMTILDNGVAVDLTDYTVELAFEKLDNKFVVQTSESGVSILDAVNGKIQCILKSNTLLVPGKVQAEVVFKKDGTRLTSLTFDFNVNKSIENGTEIESTNEMAAIDDRITKFDLLTDVMITPGTRKIITDSNGLITEIQYLDVNNNLIRNDTFTYDGTTYDSVNVIDEIRTIIGSGVSIHLQHDLRTNTTVI